jgi:hypothetical protein
VKAMMQERIEEIDLDRSQDRGRDDARLCSQTRSLVPCVSNNTQTQSQTHSLTSASKRALLISRIGSTIFSLVKTSEAKEIHSNFNLLRQVIQNPCTHVYYTPLHVIKVAHFLLFHHTWAHNWLNYVNAKPKWNLLL